MNILLCYAKCSLTMARKLCCQPNWVCGENARYFSVKYFATTWIQTHYIYTYIVVSGLITKANFFTLLTRRSRLWLNEATVLNISLYGYLHIHTSYFPYCVRCTRCCMYALWKTWLANEQLCCMAQMKLRPNDNTIGQSRERLGNESTRRKCRTIQNCNIVAQWTASPCHEFWDEHYTASYDNISILYLC